MSNYQSPEIKKEVKRLKFVFGTIYFVQGMSGLPNMSIKFFLINVLKLEAVAGQLFEGLRYIAWFIKPLWGFISDRFPVAGYHRKSWCVIMALSAVASWGLTGLCAYLEIHRAIPYFILFNVAQASYAFVDVVCDALMVIWGKILKKIGSFVNLQWLMFGIAAAIVTLISMNFQQKLEDNLLPVKAYWMIFAATGIFPLITVFVAVKNIKEERIPGYQPWLISLIKKITGKNCSLSDLSAAGYFSLLESTYRNGNSALLPAVSPDRKENCS